MLPKYSIGLGKTSLRSTTRANHLISLSYLARSGRLPLSATILCLLACAFSACTQENTSNPDPTDLSRGRRMEMVVDDQLWKAQARSTITPPVTVVFSEGDLLTITGVFETVDGSRSESMTLSVKPFRGLGTYLCSTQESGTYAMFTRFSPRPLRRYFTLRPDQGEVRITRFEQAAGIIEGTFEARVAEESRDSVHVVLRSGVFEGRF